MRISGFDDPDSSGWDALHRGTEREGFDSPSKFDMSTLSTIMPKRKPARPKPDPQGYTDEDTREWGSSDDDGDDDYARPASAGYSGARSSEFADDGDYVRPASGGYSGSRSSEFADDHDYVRPTPVGYPGARPPEFADDGYDPVEPEWQDQPTYEPEPPPLEPAWTPPRGARPPVPPRPPAPPAASRPPASHPQAPAPHVPAPPAPASHPPASPAPAAHAPAHRPLAARPLAPRPLAPRPPAPRPPAPVSRPHAAPPPAWSPPPPADWTPPPDPETRWIPHPEPWEDPGWNEPARVAPPVPVASAGSRVRPYTRTGGRTRSDHNLALEALVSTSDDGRRYRGVRSVEHRRICDLCLDTRSVAEIAAHLRLPLGVVKVLVGDMADIGLVLIHQTELILGDRSSREFMERVLAGLRAL